MYLGCQAIFLECQALITNQAQGSCQSVIRFLDFAKKMHWSVMELMLLFLLFPRVPRYHKSNHFDFSLIGWVLETVTDLLIELGMKLCMHLVEINIFSLNNVIVRSTKIMNRADKNWAYF